MSVHSDKAKQSMEKCIEALKNNFGRVRTGRANPHALDHIKVDYPNFSACSYQGS